MTDDFTEAARTAVGLIAVYRNAVNNDVDFTEEELVAALGGPQYDPEEVISALVVVAIALLEDSGQPDELLQRIALVFQDD